jgi:hypothetical protein
MEGKKKKERESFMTLGIPPTVSLSAARLVVGNASCHDKRSLANA